MRPGACLFAVVALSAALASVGTLTSPDLSGDSLTTFLTREHALGVYKGEQAAGWGPWLQMGYPFHAESEGALLYPPQVLLYAAFDLRTAYVLTCFLHFAAMGAFAWLFLRRAGVSAEGSAFAAVAFVGCGYFLRHHGHEWSYRTGAWFPLVLYCAHRVVAEGRWRWLWATAAVVGVQWLGGHFNLAYWTALAALLYAVLLAMDPAAAKERRARWRSVAAFAVSALLGMALAAVQILPCLELAGLSHRAGGVGIGAFLAFSLFPLHATRLLFPRIGENLPGAATPHETDVWVAPLVVLLLAAGWARRDWAARWALSRLLVVSALALLGIWFLPNLLLYWGLPGYALFRGPVRAVFVLSFLLCAFAASGYDAARAMGPEDRARLGRRFLGLFLAAGALLWGIGLLAGPIGDLGAALIRLCAKTGRPRTPEVHAENFRDYLASLRAAAGLSSPQLLLPLAGALLAALWLRLLAARRAAFAAALALSAGSSWVYARSFGPYAMHEQAMPRRFEKEIAFLRTDRDPYRILAWPSEKGGNHGVDGIRLPGTYYFQHFGIANVASTTPRLAAVEQIGMLWHDRSHAFPAEQLYTSLEPLGMFGVRYILSDVPRAHPLLEEVFRDRLWVYRNRADLGRAYVAADPAGRPPLAEGARARILADRGDEVVVEAESPSGGTLVLADNPYPAWEATLDGRPVAWRARSDGLCRLVDLPAEEGRHEVVFRYRSKADRRGLWISLAAAILLAAWGLAFLLRAPRGDEPGEGR